MYLKEECKKQELSKIIQFFEKESYSERIMVYEWTIQIKNDSSSTRRNGNSGGVI
jgi:hypothetical protein